MTASEITIRDISFDVSRAPDPAWLAGDVMRTVQTDALAIQIPPGERYFIRSLRRFEREIADPHLVSEIRGYARQEALHTREHERYNDALRAIGEDVDAMEGQVARQLALETPVLSVAVTCAIEQITHACSSVWIAQRHGAEVAQPFRAMWLWHSVEEIEHGAVAIDVYDAVTRDWSGPRRYLFRVNTAAVVFAAFFINWVRFGLRMLRRRQGRLTAGDVARFAWTGLVRPGLGRKVALRNLLYFKPGYRPDDAGSLALMREGRAELEVAVADMERRFPDRAATRSAAAPVAAAS
ncbi:metal-dependent hydrolase [Jannaschia sp. Os4]|uniref:metal-dependent hydrolase n=1 Tax=Jannaschia sp. Os4 TaxID=2807617 RepID=UPI00193A02FD|nr:metal-dependent hydrolase [Jannaschia sp. Os4]MBM2576787.1 metal-dependent hydrolase [Jannaschia sp. Os4]